MYDDPCPNCGHKRKRYLMSTDPNAPGLLGLLRGEGDRVMQAVARLAVLLVVFAAAVGVFALAVHH